VVAPVTAAHIIGKYLEFRLGVDFRRIGQQQIAAVERRYRAYCAGLHDDPAIEYTPAMASGQAVEYLTAAGVRRAMVHGGVIVHMLVAANEKCAVNGCRCTWTSQRH
jgi:hypothetical protein